MYSVKKLDSFNNEISLDSISFSTTSDKVNLEQSGEEVKITGVQEGTFTLNILVDGLSIDVDIEVIGF